MARLGDQIKLSERTRGALEQLFELNVAAGADAHPWYLSTRRTPLEVGAVLVRAAHAQLMAHARTRAGLLHPFTHYTKMTLREAIQRMGAGLLDSQEANELAKNVGTTLSYYRLAQALRGTGEDGWVLRAWPEDFELPELQTRGKLNRDERARLEERIAEEATRTEKTIVRSYDLSIIPAPGPNPSEILAYVKKLVETFNRLKADFDSVSAALTEAEERLDEYRTRYDAEAQWTATADAIREMVTRKGE